MRPEYVCARSFIETHPADAARLVEQHPAAESAAFLEEVSVSAAAGVIERMNQAVGAECLESMRPERGGAVVALKLSSRKVLVTPLLPPYCFSVAGVQGFPLTISANKVRRTGIIPPSRAKSEMAWSRNFS